MGWAFFHICCWGLQLKTSFWITSYTNIASKVCCFISRASQNSKYRLNLDWIMTMLTKSHSFNHCCVNIILGPFIYGWLKLKPWTPSQLPSQWSPGSRWSLKLIIFALQTKGFWFWHSCCQKPQQATPEPVSSVCLCKCTLKGMVGMMEKKLVTTQLILIHTLNTLLQDKIRKNQNINLNMISHLSP